VFPFYERPGSPLYNQITKGQFTFPKDIWSNIDPEGMYSLFVSFPVARVLS